MSPYETMIYDVLDLIFIPISSIYRLIDVYTSLIMPLAVPFFEIVCCIAIIYLLLRLVFKGG